MVTDTSDLLSSAAEGAVTSSGHRNSARIVPSGSSKNKLGSLTDSGQARRTSQDGTAISRKTSQINIMPRVGSALGKMGSITGRGSTNVRWSELGRRLSSFGSIAGSTPPTGRRSTTQRRRSSWMAAQMAQLNTSTGSVQNSMSAAALTYVTLVEASKTTNRKVQEVWKPHIEFVEHTWYDLAMSDHSLACFACLIAGASDSP